MPIGAGLLLKAGGIKPVPLWAVGSYPATDSPFQVVRPFCLYKPVGRPWQLQYIGAEITGALRTADFFTGCRNPDDTDGVIWAGIFSAVDNVDELCWCANSTDFGVSWTYAPLLTPDPVFQYSGRRFWASVASPAPGQVVVAANQEAGDSARVGYGDAGGIVLSTVSPALVGNVHADLGLGNCTPDILFRPARLSPTEADVLAIFGAIPGPAGSVSHGAISTDGGASWARIADALADMPGGTLSGACVVGTFTCDGDRALLIAAANITTNPFGPLPKAGLYATSDFSTFTELTAPTYSGHTSLSQAGGIAVLRPGQYRLLVDGTLYASGDRGATWATIGTLANGKRLRQFGGKLYGITDGAIWASGTGGFTWHAETLPTLPAGAVINDIFGPQYAKAPA
jgi:hypothetical protein